jgi:hypothetical protein
MTRSSLAKLGSLAHTIRNTIRSGKPMSIPGIPHRTPQQRIQAKTIMGLIVNFRPMSAGVIYRHSRLQFWPYFISAQFVMVGLEGDTVAGDEFAFSYPERMPG